MSYRKKKWIVTGDANVEINYFEKNSASLDRRSYASGRLAERGVGAGGRLEATGVLPGVGMLPGGGINAAGNIEGHARNDNQSRDRANVESKHSHSSLIIRAETGKNCSYVVRPRIDIEIEIGLRFDDDVNNENDAGTQQTVEESVSLGAPENQPPVRDVEGDVNVDEIDTNIEEIRYGNPPRGGEPNISYQNHVNDGENSTSRTLENERDDEVERRKKLADIRNNR